jgi:hypothetical protein
MVKIFVITRDSLLFILLVSSTSQALESAATHPTHITLQQHDVSQKAWDVEKALEVKGLDKQAAKQKSEKLFASSPLLSQKLTLLASHKELQLSSEGILEQLTLYALYEKPCELHSYAGVLGFLQKFHPKLNSTQIEIIKKIV